MECTIVCVCLQRLEQIVVVALKKKGMQRASESATIVSLLSAKVS